jgi:hypothetical protein
VKRGAPLVRTWKAGTPDWPALAEHVSLTFTRPLLYLSPLAGSPPPYPPPPAGEGRVGAGEGPRRESEPVEAPPHPDLLHSPSKTGVNALMASGEKEKIATTR